MTLIDRARAFIGLADRAPKWPPGKLSLALQGGGSFGAFTWGVLDRLLEEPDIAFDAISGASAGAVNAVLMAAGMVDGGKDEARARLEQFWRRMSRAAALLPNPADLPFGAGLELVVRSMSPYQFNPFNLNPLREALVAAVDFERLWRRSPIKLLLAATRVSDCLGLSAPLASHDRDRRRSLLGRRLCRQSAPAADDPGLGASCKKIDNFSLVWL